MGDPDITWALLEPFPGKMLPTVTSDILRATEKSQTHQENEMQRGKEIGRGDQHKSLRELGCPDWPVLKNQELFHSK